MNARVSESDPPYPEADAAYTATAEEYAFEIKPTTLAVGTFVSCSPR
jgi:hypothetical protein